MSDLLQRERVLQKELNELRKKLARMVASSSHDTASFHPLEKDNEHVVEDSYTSEVETNSRFAFASPIEQNSPLPSILLRPLSLQDPLRSKWNLGLGLPLPKRTVRSSPPDRVELALDAQYIEPVEGYVRIFGLLPSGAPWHCKMPLSTLAREGYMVIGRDPKLAQIVISEIGVSRAHAVLEYVGDQLVITDNDSTNGVFINKRRLSPFEKQAPLYDGCIVNFGETTLRIEISQ